MSLRLPFIPDEFNGGAKQLLEKFFKKDFTLYSRDIWKVWVIKNLLPH